MRKVLTALNILLSVYCGYVGLWNLFTAMKIMQLYQDFNSTFPILNVFPVVILIAVSVFGFGFTVLGPRNKQIYGCIALITSLLIFRSIWWR